MPASPFAMPSGGWIAALQRTWKETGHDNIGLIAAGVAFYGFLAIVPLLGATVLSYGLIASPATVIANMKSLTAVMPAQAAELVGGQLLHVVQASGGKKGLGLLLALAIALFGARGGAGAIMTALNIAYDEEEKRGFIATNLTALAITAAAVLVAILAVVAMAALARLEALLPGAPGIVLVVGKLLTYLVLLLAAAGAAAALYRYGPSHADARWVWLTPGSLLAAVGGVVLTLGFGFYVSSFGSYNATYGSLGAIVVLLTWLYLSAYVLLFGAELNAELERQAAVAEEPAPTPSPAPTPASRPSVPEQPSITAEYGAARLVSRVLPAIGAKRIGMASTALATVGLGLLRRPGRAIPGLIALAGAGALSWLTREPDPHEAELPEVSSDNRR